MACGGSSVKFAELLVRCLTVHARMSCYRAEIAGTRVLGRGPCFHQNGGMPANPSAPPARAGALLTVNTGSSSVKLAGYSNDDQLTLRFHVRSTASGSRKAGSPLHLHKTSQANPSRLLQAVIGPR